MKMATFQYARHLQFKRLEQSFFQKVVIFPGMWDEDTALEDNIGCFLLKKLPIREDGWWKDGLEDFG